MASPPGPPPSPHRAYKIGLVRVHLDTHQVCLHVDAWPFAHITHPLCIPGLEVAPGPCVGRELSPQTSESPRRSCGQWQLCRPVLRGRRALNVSQAEGKAQDLFITLSYKKYHIYRTEGPAVPLGLKSPESPRSSCCLARGQPFPPRRKVLTGWKSGHVLLYHPVQLT